MQFTVDREAMLRRLVAYCEIDTQADENSATCPSTEKQKTLSAKLADELRALGLADATMDEFGYVYATLPGRGSAADKPAFGLIAHVDTSPAVNGSDVKPVVHRDYDGGELPLPGDPSIALHPDRDAPLGSCVGHTIVTSDGTSLLGADNKAGVAEIMTTVDTLLRHPDIPCSPIRIGFTVDEEIGRGADRFDVERFGAVAAYTVDGGPVGLIEDETFSADSVVLTCHGVNVHPGYAKGKMTNSVKMATDVLARFPHDRLSPETTAGRDGYIHPYSIQGDEEKTVVKILIRDFDTTGLATKEDQIRAWAEAVAARYPGGRIDVEVIESYRNMREILEQHPEVVERADRAARAAGIEAKRGVIRGGTDGSRLSFMGLPTPNIFTGAHNFHSRREWVSLDDMEKTVRTLVHLASIWAADA